MSGDSVFDVDQRIDAARERRVMGPEPMDGLVPVQDAREPTAQAAAPVQGVQRCAVLGTSGTYRYAVAQACEFRGMVLVTWDRGSGRDWVRADRVRWLP